MMKIDGNKLHILDIPNSEYYKKNSLIAKKVKSAVKEFYITKDIATSIISFLTLDTNQTITVKIDQEETNRYLSIMDEKVQTYEFLYVDGFNLFYDSLEKIKNGDTYLFDSITMTLSQSNKGVNKYLNIPKDGSEINKAFYGLLYSGVSNLCIYKDTSGDLFIYPYVSENWYDNIENHVRHECKEETASIKKFNIRKKKLTLDVNVPTVIKSYVVTTPVQPREDKTDYVRKAIVNERLGNFGENLVIDYEKSNLTSADKKKVESVGKKGVHYDVKSYNPSTGLIKCIEVKCTTKGKDEPFYMTKREREFLSLHEEGYEKYIYRIYNARSNNPQFFIIKGDDMETVLEFTPISFEVSTKTPEGGR